MKPIVSLNGAMTSDMNIRTWMGWGDFFRRVREDIVQSLKLQTALTAMDSFDWSNIFNGVKGLSRTAAFKEELAREIMKDMGKSGSTIIYCTTIKDVDGMIDLDLLTS